MEAVLVALVLAFLTIVAMVIMGPKRTRIQMVFGLLMFLLILSVFLWSELNPPQADVLEARPGKAWWILRISIGLGLPLLLLVVLGYLRVTSPAAGEPERSSRTPRMDRLHANLRCGSSGTLFRKQWRAARAASQGAREGNVCPTPPPPSEAGDLLLHRKGHAQRAGVAFDSDSCISVEHMARIRILPPPKRREGEERSSSLASLAPSSCDVKHQQWKSPLAEPDEPMHLEGKVCYPECSKQECQEECRWGREHADELFHKGLASKRPAPLWTTNRKDRDAGQKSSLTNVYVRGGTGVDNDAAAAPPQHSQEQNRYETLEKIHAFLHSHSRRVRRVNYPIRVEVSTEEDILLQQQGGDVDPAHEKEHRLSKMPSRPPSRPPSRRKSSAKLPEMDTKGPQQTKASSSSSDTSGKVSSGKNKPNLLKKSSKMKPGQTMKNLPLKTRKGKHKSPITLAARNDYQGAQEGTGRDRTRKEYEIQINAEKISVTCDEPTRPQPGELEQTLEGEGEGRAPSRVSPAAPASHKVEMPIAMPSRMNQVCGWSSAHNYDYAHFKAKCKDRSSRPSVIEDCECGHNTGYGHKGADANKPKRPRYVPKKPVQDCGWSSAHNYDYGHLASPVHTHDVPTGGGAPLQCHSAKKSLRGTGRRRNLEENPQKIQRVPQRAQGFFAFPNEGFHKPRDARNSALQSMRNPAAAVFSPLLWFQGGLYLLFLLDFVAIVNLLITFSQFYKSKAVDPTFIGFSLAATISLLCCLGWRMKQTSDGRALASNSSSLINVAPSNAQVPESMRFVAKEICPLSPALSCCDK